MSDLRRVPSVAVAFTATVTLMCVPLLAPSVAHATDDPPVKAQQATSPTSDTTKTDSAAILLPAPSAAGKMTEHNNTRGTIAASLSDHGYDRWGVQIGGFNAASAPDQTNNPGWGILGITYRLQPAGKRTLFQPDLYTDIATTEGSVQYSTTYTELRHGRMFWGIGLSERTTLYLMKKSLSAYVGGGGGLYRLETFRDYRHYTDGPSSSDGNNYNEDIRSDGFGFRPGYKAFAGLNHRSGIYLEMGWHDAGRMAGLPYRGLSYSIGFRR